MTKVEQNGDGYVQAILPPAGGVCMRPDVDSDLFYPRTDGEILESFERRIFLAKQLCRTCVEQVACLTATLEYEAKPLNRKEQRAPLGVRAATTDEERRLRRRRQK